ncbi:hypothetical protein COD90_07895 [Bacillus cereus]|nr:hypothetical protein COD90_07895 [Bacillus cereus]
MNEYIMQPVDIREWARGNILLTSEAIEILGISRSRMNVLLKKGQLEPIKRTGATSLFLLEDVIKKRDDLIRKRRIYGPKD